MDDKSRKSRKKAIKVMKLPKNAINKKLKLKKKFEKKFEKKIFGINLFLEKVFNFYTILGIDNSGIIPELLFLN
jgi:hypothetical protein